VPSGRLSINAVPWAEVWLDGRAIGQTPVGNVLASIGPHEVVFRHPSLGERRQTVDVVADTTTRVGIDFSSNR
jgi:serine/threonine-protein kinase